MPDWIQAMWSGFLNICTTAAGRILVSLGFSTISFTGIDTSLTWLKEQAVANFTSSNMLPGVVQLMTTLKIGTVISLILSAILVRFMLTRLFVGATKVWTMGL